RGEDDSMNEREAFIEAIAAHRDEDTPRLVFADWLQENGEEDRAEFIRLECELATHRRELAWRSPLPEHLQELWNLSRELFDLRSSFWFEPFFRALGAEETPRATQTRRWPSRLWQRLTGEPREAGYNLEHFTGGDVQLEAWGNGPVSGLSIWRGLIGSLDVCFESPFPIHDLAAAFRLEPVTCLDIRLGANLAQWQRMNSPCLCRVRNLSVDLPNTHRRKSAATFEGVTHGENWSGLRDLHLWCPTSENSAVPTGYVEQLLRSPLLPGIHTLWATINFVDLPRLTTSPGARTLRGLRLWCRASSPEAGEIIGSAVFRSNLELLDLSVNELGDEGVRRLVVAGPWPALRSLNLGGNGTTDACVEHLLPLIPQLSELALVCNSITDDAALALADAIDPAKLTWLSLSYNPLSPEVADMLRARFGSRFQFRTEAEDRIESQESP
ncbi:MAG: TIGR02996 domain-containing protein, partial [Planctomycetia bacterium]|nr:TIGR02996 domain-containing protein [Planctomycetia bacterium]